VQTADETGQRSHECRVKYAWIFHTHRSGQRVCGRVYGGQREEERKRMRDRYQPRCKFYRPDKSGLVDGARKDTLLCIYIPGVIRYAA